MAVGKLKFLSCSQRFFHLSNFWSFDALFISFNCYVLWFFARIWRRFVKFLIYFVIEIFPNSGICNFLNISFFHTRTRTGSPAPYITLFFSLFKLFLTIMKFVSFFSFSPMLTVSVEMELVHHSELPFCQAEYNSDSWCWWSLLRGNYRRVASGWDWPHSNPYDLAIRKVTLSW